MGYLNNSSIVVDATLTKKGRELLARGQNEFRISYFALADDEIDYSMYNTDHPLGSAYYGSAIENLPITEAVTDESQLMKYKLVTLPKNTIRIPVVAVDQNNYTIKPGQNPITVSPSTVNYPSGNSNFGYTAIISNSDVLQFESVTPTPAQQTGQDDASPNPPIISDLESAQTVAVTGMSFEIQGRPSTLRDRTATVTFIGNETGGSETITVVVKKLTAESADIAI